MYSENSRKYKLFASTYKAYLIVLKSIFQLLVGFLRSLRLGMLLAHVLATLYFSTLAKSTHTAPQKRKYNHFLKERTKNNAEMLT